MATEYIAGPTLRDWCAGRNGQPVPFRQVAQILLAVSHAVAHAHGQGVLQFGPRDADPTGAVRDTLAGFRWPRPRSCFDTRQMVFSASSNLDELRDTQQPSIGFVKPWFQSRRRLFYHHFTLHIRPSFCCVNNSFCCPSRDWYIICSNCVYTLYTVLQKHVIYVNSSYFPLHLYYICLANNWRHI